MLKVLERFHKHAARQVTGMMETCGQSWSGNTPVVVEMEATGLHPIREYIRRRQVTIVENVACQPIYELCAEVKQITRTIRMMRWWDQDVVNEPEE